MKCLLKGKIYRRTDSKAESEDAKDIYKKAGNLIKEFYASGTDGEYIEYYAVDNFIADNIEDYVTCIEVLLK